MSQICIDNVWTFNEYDFMTRRYTKHGIQFEWDDEKALNNIAKHGISFETACDVFFDPFVKTLEMQNIEGELRDVIIGMTT